MEIFEKASRIKLRFKTAKGSLDVEDLWEMPLLGNIFGDFSLNDLAKSINRVIKENDEESFVVAKYKTEIDVLEELRFSIVKHVISVRLVEKEAAEKATLKKAQKEKLLTIIAGKKDAKLEGKSLKDLEKMVDAL